MLFLIFSFFFFSSFIFTPGEHTTAAHLVSVLAAGTAGGVAQGVMDHFIPEVAVCQRLPLRMVIGPIFRAAPVSCICPK